VYRDSGFLGDFRQFPTRRSQIQPIYNNPANMRAAASQFSPPFHLFDVSEGHVSGVKKAYEAGGIAAIKAKTRGRRKGEKRTLTLEQEKEIQGIIADKSPEQHRFKECMWNRNNIRSLILQKYKIEMPLSTLGYYLERWGFSVQRPTKRAYKQDEAKVNNWVETEFPGISECAKLENAEIYFGDESRAEPSNAVAGGTPLSGKRRLSEPRQNTSQSICCPPFPIAANCVLCCTRTI
jgi:transposase